MIDYPEAGYTPANLTALLNATGLSGVAFCQQFGLAEPTFKQNKSGVRAMSYAAWQDLQKKVEDYLKNNQNTA